jgi:hypothetical protein
MQVLAVDGSQYSAKVFRQAIATAGKDQQPLTIRVRADGATSVHKVHYDGGLKFPHLVRVPGTTDYLKVLLTPKSTGRGS